MLPSEANIYQTPDYYSSHSNSCQQDHRVSAGGGGMACYALMRGNDDWERGDAL